MNTSSTTRINKYRKAGMSSLALVFVLRGTVGTRAEDTVVRHNLPVTIVPDQTAQIRVTNVEIEPREQGTRVSGKLIGHRLRQRVFFDNSPRSLVIQLLNDAGNVRVVERIKRSSHAQHQHGNQAFRFDVTLQAVPMTGDTVHIAIDHGSAAPAPTAR